MEGEGSGGGGVVGFDGVDRLGPMLLYFFNRIQRFFNKLECLSLTSLSSLV